MKENKNTNESKCEHKNRTIQRFGDTYPENYNPGIIKCDDCGEEVGYLAGDDDDEGWH